MWEKAALRRYILENECFKSLTQWFDSSDATASHSAPSSQRTACHRFISTFASLVSSRCPDRVIVSLFAQKRRR